MNTITTNRIINLGKELWNLLTEDEQEKYFCDNGALGFLEDVITILHIDFPWTDIDLTNYIYDQIFVD
jgi:hypothetical protein